MTRRWFAQSKAGFTLNNKLRKNGVLFTVKSSGARMIETLAIQAASLGISVDLCRDLPSNDPGLRADITGPLSRTSGRQRRVDSSLKVSKASHIR